MERNLREGNGEFLVRFMQHTVKMCIVFVKFYSMPSTNNNGIPQYAAMASYRSCYCQGWMIKNSPMHRLIVVKLNSTNRASKELFNHIASASVSFPARYAIVSEANVRTQNSQFMACATMIQ